MKLNFKEDSTILLVDANFAELSKIIEPAWNAQEKEEFILQAEVEKTTLEFYQKGANYVRPFLNNYSSSWALTTYDKAGNLIDECFRTVAINQQ